MLTQRLEFDLACDIEILASAPSSSAVFLLRSREDAEPYVGKTANLRRRLTRLLGPAETGSRRLNLRKQTRIIEFQPTGSDFESGFLLYRLLRATFPHAYTKKLRLRFAPLVKLHLENKYPRASVTRRIGKLHGRSLYYGPFLSRAAAEKFMNDSLDFFKMRRCVEDLHPDPAFPGCIYSEMKMCLAPCFKGCSDAEYRNEVEGVQNFFDSAGLSLVREIERARERASEELAFEEAATQHARIDKLKPLLSQLPEAVQRIDRMLAVMVQPSAEPGCVALFRVDAAVLSGPIAFPIQAAEHTKSQSMEARVDQALQSTPVAGPVSVLETMEHLAILKRWLYRGTRVGEIFFANEAGELPMRRLVRGISRVYRGESAEPAPVPAPPAS